MGMNALYQDVIKRGVKKTGLIIALILGMAVLVALAQGSRFVSSLWVIAEFGFTEWQKQILDILQDLLAWAFLAGWMFASDMIVQMRATEIKKVLAAAAVNFGIGFLIPYLFVVILAVMLYVPLGVLSFIFPDRVVFMSMGFAFLSAAYIVFLWIAVDTPALLLHIIKTARPYTKLLAVLFGLLLFAQTFSNVLSVFLILMRNSGWRVHLPAFILAYGGTLLATLVINLGIIRKRNGTINALAITAVFVFSIISGNISVSLFHWGEYASAIVAAVLAPMVYSAIFNFIQKNFVQLIPVLAGLTAGLGLGLFLAFKIKLRIIGQNWFGMICGTGLAAGFGVSLGFIFGPRIGELLTKFVELNPLTDMWLSIGLTVGIFAGVVIGGFIMVE